MKRSIPIAALAVTTLLTGCVGEQSEPRPVEDIEWMRQNAGNYLEDASWRRGQLEASLWRPELPYARKRLASYGLGDRGWDLLPTIDARVGSVRVDQDDTSFVGRDLVPDETPESREEWLALGEDVFWSMPMRRDAYIEWAVENPDVWDDVGFQRREDGTIRGLVRFRDARGDVRTGATCGFCHGDSGMAGRASRSLDLGKTRALYGEAFGIDNGEYATWGAGTVDVTDDGVNDALAIPDLWGVDEQSHINSSGAVKLDSPAALALRFETQYITGHSMEGRPSRVLTWALAMYVLSLDAPDRGVLPSGVDDGDDVFERACASCHRPEDGYSGGLVSADSINSDPRAAQSILRGTGFYKTPSLVGVSDGAPYLHDASVPTLRDLLDGGHPRELDLTEDEKNSLIRFLKTL